MKPNASVSFAQALESTRPEEFDLSILGGGSGSTVAAWTFASEGKSVAVVDREYIGGACRIGLSETEAKARGTGYRLFKVAMDTNLRARTLLETRGFVKALVEDRGDRILGLQPSVSAPARCSLPSTLP